MQIYNDKSTQRKIGVMLGYINYAIKIVAQLLYVPIMISLLGQSEYGVYQLVASVISYLSLLNFGLGGAYLRFFAQCKGHKEEEAKLNGTYMIIFIFFSFLALCLGLLLTFNSNMVLGEKLSGSELELAQVLFGIMTINMTLTFPISVLSSIVISREAFLFQRIVELIQTIFNPFLVISILIMGKGAVGIVLISTGITIWGGIVNLWYVVKKLKAPFCFKRVEFQVIRRIGVFSFFIFVNSIIDQINWNVDKFLLGRLVGTVSIAVYSIGAQINNIYVQATDMIASVMAPKVNLIVAQEKRPTDALNKMFIKVGRLQFYVILPIVVGFIMYGKEFIFLWVGDGYDESYYVTLFLIVPAAISLSQSLGVDIQRALNKHQYRTMVYAVLAIINLLISILLIPKFGAVGAAMGTAISILIGNGIIMNIIYKKIIGLDILSFWKNIMSILPSMIVPLIFSYILNSVFYEFSWFFLAVKLLIFCLLYVLGVYFIVVNTEEKCEINKILRFMKHNAHRNGE